jgi:hypothetical protein
MEELLLNLTRFDAEENATLSTDLAPAITIDHLNKLTENIKTLNEIISVNELVPMTGDTIRIYKTAVKTKPSANVKEGEIIPLTEAERKLVKEIKLELKKYRKSTTAEAIQKVGRDRAINDTDAVLVKVAQKDIKDGFFENLSTGTGTATPGGAGFQQAVAAAWGAVQTAYEDVDATPIYFVNPSDLATYLGSAQITMQTAFGLSYIENFVGLGTVFVSPSIPAGTVKATAKENLFCGYVPADTSDMAQTFNLTSDETGLVGMSHYVVGERAAIDTLIITGAVFYPEAADRVINVNIATE